MSIQIQFRRGTTAEHSTFTGAVGEITVDTTKDTAVVHDNSQVGGFALLREDGSNCALSDGSASTPAIKFSSSTTTGIYSPGTNQFAIATNGVGRITIDASGNVVVGSTLTAGSFIPTSSTVPTNGLYSPGTNQVALSTNGTGRLFVNASGNFGVGKSPSTRFHSYIDAGDVTLLNETGAGASYLRLRTNNQTNASYNGIFSEYAGTTNDWFIRGGQGGGNILVFGTNNTERARIDSSGRLGIGTSSPGVALTVLGTGTAGTIRAQTPNAPSQSAKIEASRGGTGASNTSIGLEALSDSGGTFSARLYYTSGSDTAYSLIDGSALATRIYSAGSERIRIDSTGRVGVGTTNPSAPFQIGTIAANTYALFDDGTNARITFSGSTSAAGIYSTTTGFANYEDLEIRSAATIFKRDGTNESARLDGSGRLLVGTSSSSTNDTLVLQGNSSGTANASQLRLRRNTTIGDGTGIAAISFEDSAGNGYASITGYGDGTSGVGDYPGRLVFSTTADGASSPTERMRIDSSGRVGVGTTSPGGALDVTTSGTVGLFRVSPSAGVVTYSTLSNAGGYGSAIVDATQHIYRVAGSEALRIDTSQRLLVGTSSSRSVQGDHTPQIQLEGTGYASSTIGIIANSNDANGSYVFLGKSRGTTVGSNTIVQDGDSLGQIRFLGSDGVGDFVQGANIEAVVDGTPGSNDLPSRLVFSTCADGASSPTERMRIDNSGFISLGGDTNTGFSNPSADNLAITTGGTERLRITSDGKLGLGTSSPNNTITVFGPSSDGSGSSGNVAEFAGPSRTNGFQVFVNDTNNNCGIQTKSADALIINPNGGNVGVGTTSPAVTTHISSSSAETLRLQHAASPYQTFYLGSNRGAFILSNSSYLQIAAESSSNNTIMFDTGGSERARIDSSGRLLVGTSTARVSALHTAKLQVEGSDFSASTVSITSTEGGNFGASLHLGKLRGSSAVSGSDTLGRIQFNGFDGSALIAAAHITAQVDGTPGANDMPGRLVFSTTADGASSPTEQLRITSDRYVRLASGTGGIQFNGDTASANALDDYEEGTFTPTVTGLTNFGSPTGFYVKIGKTVKVMVRVPSTFGSTASISNIAISAFPFAAGGNGSPVQVGGTFNVTRADNGASVNGPTSIGGSVHVSAISSSSWTAGLTITHYLTAQLTYII